MGCIIAASGSFCLCGKRIKVNDVINFFTNKITCAPCLIRQDAMFARDYQQKEFACWFNNYGLRQCILKEEYHKYGTLYHSIPHKAMFKGIILMWDMKTLKGAIKLGKIGAHGMGVAK